MLAALFIGAKGQRIDQFARLDSTSLDSADYVWIIDNDAGFPQSRRISAGELSKYFSSTINIPEAPVSSIDTANIVTVPSAPGNFGTGTASKDGILYVAIQNSPNTGFIEMFDLNEDPLNPPVIDTLVEMNDVSEILIYGSYMYVINGTANNQNGTNKFNVYNVEDATNPVLLGSTNTGNFGVILKHYKGKIFAGTDSGINLFMIDATDPDNLVFQNVTAPEAGGTLTTAIEIYGDYLFLAERPGTGIKVFDLAADPLDPPYLFTITSSMNSASQIFRSLEINGTHLWGRVSTEDDDGNQYFIFSLDSLEQGTAREIGKYNPPLSNSPTVTNQTFKIYNDNIVAPDQFGLHVYDISDFDNITEELFLVNGGGFGAFVKGWTIWNNVMYVANGSTAGVKFYAIPFGDRTETFSGRFGEMTTGRLEVRGLVNTDDLGVKNTAIIQSLEVDSINGVAYNPAGSTPDLQAVLTEGATANITGGYSLTLGTGVTTFTAEEGWFLDVDGGTARYTLDGGVNFQADDAISMTSNSTITFDGTGGVTTNGLLPTSSDAFDLGSATLAWQQAYIGLLNMGATNQAGTARTIQSRGSGANINLELRAKGTANVQIGNGNLDLTNNPIINVANPTNAQDAATKAYVDFTLQTVSSTTTLNAGVKHANVTSAGVTLTLRPITAVGDVIYVSNYNNALTINAGAGQDFIGSNAATGTVVTATLNQMVMFIAISSTRWVVTSSALTGIGAP